MSDKMFKSMRDYLELVRCHQWLKNLLILFPPFLGGSLLQVDSLSTIFLPLISFSAGASCIYIVNDVMDMQQDVHHPRKSLRPLPAGRICKKSALSIAFILCVSAVLSGWFISFSFLFYLLLYLLISVAYSWQLKTIPLLEMFCVVSGFLLRLLAGGSVFNVQISEWLFLTVFLLALYLVCGKRLSEQRHEDGISPIAVRPVLSLYPAGFLEGCMFISGSAVLVTYMMYVINHANSLWLVLLCCFGLLAYLLRVLSGKGGDPTRSLLKDPLLFIVSMTWGLLVGWSIYLG